MKPNKGRDDPLRQRHKSLGRIQELTEELGYLYANRKRWREESDYHICSLAQTAMFRFKALCSDALFSRTESISKI